MAPQSLDLFHSDAGVPMKVLRVAAPDAMCVDDQGDTWVVGVDSVMPVEIDEMLLVAGGTAVGRVVQVIDRPAREPFVERRNLSTRPWASLNPAPESPEPQTHPERAKLP
jgi:hypothetical protein